MQSAPDDERTETITRSTIALSASSSPSGKTGTGASGPTQASFLGASITAPAEAMRVQEMRRFRAFLVFSSFSCVIVALIIPLVRGDRIATWILCSTSAITALAALALLLVLRDESKYRPWQSTAFAMLAGTAVAGGYYLFGVTSAMVMIVPIGTYLLALGESFKGALLCQINVQASHFLISVLQILGVIPNVALVGVVHHELSAEIGMLIASQGVMVAAFLMARGVRKSTLATLEQLNIAVTDNARRQALLMEAKQELELARKIGGPGRFTQQTLSGFKLGNILGRGAMGEVYEAVHQETQEPAAIKLLNQQSQHQPSTIARFRREVEIARTLNVENVVKVLEVSGADAPVPFLAMERLYGSTLSSQLQGRSRLSTAELTQLVKAICRGIEAAHAAGIIHRDLKPSNLFLHRRAGKSTWKILDFGVSKFMDDGDTITAGAIVGTPAYMSPEQAKSDELSPRTDLYALGVIAYRSLTGRPAFAGKDLPTILHSVVYDMPPKPSAIAELSPDYDALLAIAMAKDPDDRFANAAEFAEAFASAEASELGAALRLRGETQMGKAPWGQRGDR